MKCVSKCQGDFYVFVCQNYADVNAGFNFSLEKLLLREMVAMKELDQLGLEVNFVH